MRNSVLIPHLEHSKVTLLGFGESLSSKESSVGHVMISLPFAI